jgi:hypothetical protein
MELDGYEINSADVDREVTVIDEHEFALDGDEAEGLDGLFSLTRWMCACGDRGGWQDRSAEWTYDDWLRHAARSGA